MRAIWITLAAVFGCVATEVVVAQDRDAIFEQANEAFESGDFAGAEAGYQKLVKAGQFSEDVFFNLGNSIYRQNRPGEAALWFQRARVFDPRMPEASQNLRFLKKTGGYLEVKREPLDAFLFNRRPAELTFYTSLGAWIFLLSVVSIFVIRRLRDWRPLMIILALLGLMLAISSYWAGKRRAENLAIEHFAVIVGADVAALTAPAPGAKEVIAMPEGSEVRILQDRGPWKYIEIPGEVRGWVEADHAVAIWPVE